MAIGLAVGERELILQLKQGRTGAAGELMDHYGESLMRFLYSILGSREAAEDAFQESWVKVMERIGQFQDELDFGPWLFRIARNTAYDSLRKKRRWWSLDTGAAGDSENRPMEIADPADFSGEVVTRQTVRRLLELLSPAFREVLFLRFFHDLAYEEIAELCGVPLGTVKSRLKRGLDYLAKNMMEKNSHVQ
jgi:RNA polymerase sigma-70 factor (ECF subfamily)